MKFIVGDFFKLSKKEAGTFEAVFDRGSLVVYVRACECVCVRARERARARACVCVCMFSRLYTLCEDAHAYIKSKINT